jgi:hypothetical protein
MSGSAWSPLPLGETPPSPTTAFISLNAGVAATRWLALGDFRTTWPRYSHNPTPKLDRGASWRGCVNWWRRLLCRGGHRKSNG